LSALVADCGMTGPPGQATSTGIGGTIVLGALLIFSVHVSPRFNDIDPALRFGQVSLVSLVSIYQGLVTEIPSTVPVSDIS
jgi:hypothetical protein